MEQSFDPKSVTKYWNNQEPVNIEELKKKNKKYTDSTFPANENIIYSKDSEGEYTSEDKIAADESAQALKYDLENLKIEWKRPEEIDNKKKWELFGNDIEYDDASQGQLANAALISVLVSLSEHDESIINKFRTDSYNSEGYYEIVLYIDDEWQIVIVDDLFPTIKTRKDVSRFVFCSSLNENNVLWASLLEKAYAKIKGGYSNLCLSNVQEVMLAFTGNRAQEYKISRVKESETFRKIRDAIKGDNLVCAKSKNDDDIEKVGIVGGVYYSILKADKYLNKYQLVQLRNTWGSTEWIGKFSDYDDIWENEKNLVTACKFKKKEDGIFFMIINDFHKYFESFTSSKP